MTGGYRVKIADAALAEAVKLAEDDPQGVAAVLRAADLLADDPRPRGAFPYGPDAVRVHVGFYRMLADIDERERTVTVVHIGRAP